MPEPRTKPPNLVYRIGETFPASDPLARFNAGLALILNDLILVARETVEPDIENWAFQYYFRTASAHLWEGAAFIRNARKRYAEVAAFMDDVPEASAMWSSLESFLEPPEADALQAAIKSARDLLWHYPEMLDRSSEEHDPLRKTLTILEGEEGRVTQGSSLKDLRCDFADDIAAVLTYGPEVASLRDDEQEQAIRAFAERVRDATITLQNLCRACLSKYFEQRQATVRAL